MPELPPIDNGRSSLVKYAALCLNRKPYFRGSLKQKLTTRAKKIGLDDSISLIDKILDDLQDEGYLDDHYLAESFVRRQLDKGYGSKIIAYKLKRLYLDPSVLESTLSNISVDDQVICAKKYLRRYSTLDRYKLASKLYSRGFTSSVVRRLFDVETQED